MRLLLVVVLFFSSGTASLASPVLFNIDLSGTSELGNELRLFGALRIDPAAPIDGSNIGAYSLFVQRNAETPVRSLSFFSIAVPNDTLGTMQLAWSQTGDDLYISRTSAADSTITYVGFSLFPPQPTASFNLGSGALAHSITYGDASGLETAVLKTASGPDGPNGFRLGTAAVPVSAPSSLALGLAGVGLMAPLMRRRKQATQR
jgi:PEP-CTERM motif-containing protein